MNQGYLVLILGLGALIGFFVSLISRKDIDRKPILFLLLLRAIGALLFTSGLVFGWYGHSSFFVAVILPSVGYIVFLGILETALRRQKNTPK